ncbi:MAG: S-layer family protein [Anaerolineae bacterium]|nr:S-layer family protein [Phycisphaerae bacterium]
MNRPSSSSSSSRRGRLALAAACALVSAYTHQAQGQTFNVSWVGSASSFYSAASNWSTNVMPNNNVGLGDFFNVTINRVGGASVTLNADPTILNLTIGANAGNALLMGDTRTLTLIGANGGGPITLGNSGTINLGGTAASTANLFLNGTSANVSGGGTITMFGNSVLSGAGTVTSNNTIIGLGNLGNDTIAFINNGTVTANGGSLTLDARLSGGFVNNGLLQALAGGTMVFSGNGGGIFTNTGATISAAAAGSRVNLMDGATIVGGTISTFGLNSSIFFVPTGHSATLNGVTSTADVNVAIGSTLNLAGTITNNSRIRTNSSVGVATFNTGAATVTLNGTGSLVLSQFAGALGNLVGTGTLVNGSSHTIAGAGTIGNNALAMDNSGTISANLGGQLLVIDPNSAARNSGTLEARNGGTLRLVGPTFLTNSGGHIVAADASSVVELTSALQVGGGELRGPGVIRVPSGNAASAPNVINNGNVEVLNNATFSIGGSFINNGTILVLSTGSITALNANTAGDTVNLAGNGTVILSGNQARLDGGVGGTLVIGANTIRGRGFIGVDSIALSNSGTISADVTSASLIVDPSAGGFVNTGTLQARNGGRLLVRGNGGGSYNNNAGTFLALDTNSSVTLDSGAIINGGTFITSAVATDISVNFGETATLNNVNNLGLFLAQAGSTLNVGTAMLNNGTVSVSAAGQPTNMLLTGGTVNFSGTGLVRLNESGGPATFGGTGTLVNSASHRFTGSGFLGNNVLAIRNLGTIDANVASRALVVDNGLGSWVNSGTMQASNGGTLELSGAGVGPLLGNTGGRIIANNASSVRTKSLTINGGTLATNGTGTIAVAAASAGTLSNLTSTGHVVVEGGRTLFVDGNLTNTGTVSISPESGQGLVQTLPGSTLTNNGTILLREVTENGSFPVLNGAGVLNNNGLIRGDGTIDVDSAAGTFTINNAGAIESDGFGLGIGSFQNPPHIVAINNTGVVRTKAAAGNANFGVNLQITGSGSLDVQSDSALVSFAAIATPSTALNGVMLQAGNPSSLGNVDGTGSLAVGTSFLFSPLPGDVTVKHVRGLNGVAVQVGTLTTTAGGGTLGTSTIEGTLSIGSLGPARWDLTDHDLVLDYAGATALPTIENHIATARNGGLWDGSGLTSTSARDAAAHNTTLGAIEASNFIAANGTTTFSGQSVDGTSVLVKYTYYGDTDFNGVVDFDDYSRTDAGFNNNRTGWFNGDFDYNGVVDFDDYSLIDLAFNTQSGALARAMLYLNGSDRSDRGMNVPSLRLVQDHFEQFGNAYATEFLNNVPEPTGAVVISGLAALAASGRRRRAK